MSNRVWNPTIVTAALVSTVLVTILFGFFEAWALLDRELKNNNPERMSIHYQYLFDTDITQPEEALQQSFVTSDLNHSPVRYGDLNQWFLLRFKNETNLFRSIVNLLDNPMTDHYKLYEINHTGKPIFIAEMGDLVDDVPINQRVLPHHQFFLDAFQEKTFLIHRQTKGSPYIPFVILDENIYEKYVLVLHLIWGAMIGVVILMSAYNLVLYIGVRDKAYIFYVGYITTLLLLLGVVHGFGYYIFPIWLQQKFSAGIIVIDTAATYFTLSFARTFLRFEASDGWTNKAALWLTQIILAFGVASIWLPEYISATSYAIVQVATYLVVVTLIGHKLRSRFRWTKYYIISWIPFFCGAAIGYLLFSGALEYSFLYRHALLFSVIFETAFISMALADRLGEMERQRLFQSTHDFKYLLANEALLELAIEKHSNTKLNNLSIIAIEIFNYDAVIPYVDSTTLPSLIHGMANYFTKSLSRYFDVISIDPTNKYHKKCALIRGDLFGFLTNETNEGIIKIALRTLSSKDNFNPLQSTIPYRIQCIFGVSVQSNRDKNYTELISNAKRAINQAQEQNLPWVIYNPKNIESERKIRLAQDLGNAITKNELKLYHQPQLLITDPGFRSSEALLRWNHPELGDISPTEFVKIAEETGLIRRLTHWVLSQAFYQATILLKNGHHKLNISVNISAQDISRADFIPEINNLINKYNIDPRIFTLEITETAKLINETALAQNFAKLTKIGFYFAIDDFGTGYSSLNYASVHPFKELKIDREFVQEMLISSRQLTIVTATIRMAKELGLHITAEGVEDADTYSILKNLECDKIQGYFVGQPMPFEQFYAWKQQIEAQPDSEDTYNGA